MHAKPTTLLICVASHLTLMFHFRFPSMHKYASLHTGILNMQACTRLFSRRSCPSARKLAEKVTQAHHAHLEIALSPATDVPSTFRQPRTYTHHAILGPMIHNSAYAWSLQHVSMPGQISLKFSAVCRSSSVDAQSMPQERFTTHTVSQPSQTTLPHACATITCVPSGTSRPTPVLLFVG